MYAGTIGQSWAVFIEITEIVVALRRRSIIVKHRVDSFLQLSAAALVYAASIDPDPIEIVLERFAACVNDFVVSLLLPDVLGVGFIKHVFEVDFLVFPAV